MNVATFRQQAPAYARLMRLDKPVGTLLLLWPTLAGLWIAAEATPPLALIAAFAAGAFLMRSCGCVINDIADRHVDGLVERTAARPLATGRVTLLEAAALFGLLAISALGVALTLNAPAIRLACVGMAIAATYPFMKRWTHFPQVVLGVAFSWGIPMAFAAATGRVAPLAWLLFAGSVAWVVAYDTQYAMADRRDDAKAGVKSLALLLGKRDHATIATLQGVAVAAFIAVGIVADHGPAWFVAVAAAAGILASQHRMLRERAPAGCMRAFRSNAWVGFALFAGAVLEHSPPPGGAG